MTAQISDLFFLIKDGKPIEPFVAFPTMTEAITYSIENKGTLGENTQWVHTQNVYVSNTVELVVEDEPS